MSPRKAKRTQAPSAPTGQTYGEAGAQIAAQRAIPLPDTTALPPAAVMGNPTPAGSLGAFDRATERPGEPVTAGAPLGAGPGPDVLPPGVSANDPILYLEAAARRYGYPELFALVAKSRAKQAVSARGAVVTPGGAPEGRMPIFPEDV